MPIAAYKISPLLISSNVSAPTPPFSVCRPPICRPPSIRVSAFLDYDDNKNDYLEGDSEKDSLESDPEI